LCFANLRLLEKNLVNTQNPVINITQEMRSVAETTLVGIETVQNKQSKFLNALAICGVQKHLQQVGIIEKNATPKRVTQNGGIYLEISEFPDLGCIVTYYIDEEFEIPFDRCRDYAGYFVVYFDYEDFHILGFATDFEEPVYFEDLISIEDFRESFGESVVS
jgi:Protein of unknown function (DUF1822)